MNNLPETMRAVLLTEHGGPQMLQYREDVPVPMPSPGELLVGEGRYVTAGAIAGPVVEFDLRTVYLKHLDLIGSTQGTRDDFARVRDLALAGRIRPVLAGTYPLEDIARAQADFAAKDFLGKLVVTPERAQ